MMSDDAPAQEDISGYLSELRQAGKVDSSGGFTLDINNTVKKLSQFRLTDPRQYVLNLISCANARGATWIQAETSAWEFRLGFDGAAFNRAELQNLFHSVYEPGSSNPGCADLALALLGSRPFDPQWVVFETWDGRHGHFVQIYEDQLYIHEILDPPWNAAELRSCFRLKETPVLYRNYDSVAAPYWATVQNWLNRLTGVKKPECEHLETRCRFGPAPLWIDGQRVPLPTSTVALDLIGEGEPPVVMRHLLRHTHKVKGSPLWGRVQVNGLKTSNWHWIVNGVSFPDPRPANVDVFQAQTDQIPVCPFPIGVNIQVYADHLTKDISQNNVIDNPGLRQSRAEVEQVLLPALLQLPPEVKPEQPKEQPWQASTSSRKRREGGEL